MTSNYDIGTHYDKIQNFRNQIKLFVEKEFSKENIPIATKPNLGFYFNDDYRMLLDIQLNGIGDCLYNNRDIGPLKDSFRPAITINKYGNILIGNFLIGKGDESLKNKIVRVVKEIPYSNDFFSMFSDIYKSYIQIENKSKGIEDKLNNIMDDIYRHKYKTKVKCCPKKFIFF
ncbi:hypothetical protein [Candidatus Nitrosocosmicus sp. SS]|uniref:hypothetical protein n=1 Tax=Candidatus Nitrosocosmicus agrestis TaxID=2563600 RepID=UPI00122E6AA3|nr:hypothetical protein [Candidatus Nitrosocosmicus sp. SS]KAA2282174.1 hypothetical protein F1Z66_07015 [Candidatus Nitrosocosmicus sp. SS]KAF0869980.1 hypothetical protein E5N71_01795 [Candidatus Nitrosocosmicus sp. SS]